ncbi:synaptotagmin C2 domain protein, Syn1, partial [Cichlidogyrus casuarinus]
MRVEQAQFQELSLSVHSNQGCICTITPSVSGGISAAFGRGQSRSFRPDLVLVRQHCSSTNKVEWESILQGFAYGNVPCINSLQAVYGMSNRPWTVTWASFGQLICLRNSLGRERFPLISQSFHSSSKELMNPPNLPTVMKFGNSFFGEGKVRIDQIALFQDLGSVVPLTQGYVTMESFVEAKCAIHLQKIGNRYKAYNRKSVAGSWKSNVGSSIIERSQVTEQFKLWLDEASKIFDGLDICGLEVLLSKSDEHVIFG